MTLMKMLCGLTLALALCAGLLAGCGTAGDKAADAVQTQAVQEASDAEDTAQADETPEEPADGEPGFDSAALAEALSDVCNVGPGAAGSSIRAVKAANELVTFAALNWNDNSAQAIGDAVALWFDALDEAEKEEFHLGRELVEAQAEALTQNPFDPDLLGAQEDAGVEPIPSDCDVSHTEDLLQVIREKTGAVSELD